MQSVYEAKVRIETRALVLLAVVPYLVLAGRIEILLICAAVLAMLLVGEKKPDRIWRTAVIYIAAVTIALLVYSAITRGFTFAALGHGMIISSRFSLVIVSGCLFSVSTDSIEILSAFVRWKIPHRYALVLIAANRAVPILNRRVGNILDAQRARGSFGLAIFKPKLVSGRMMAVLIPTLNAALELAGGLVDSLISRGYREQAKICPPRTKMTYADLLLIAAMAVLLVFNSFSS
jgi:energy-coupling factor transporter transmembrane protein EcfT